MVQRDQNGTPFERLGRQGRLIAVLARRCQAKNHIPRPKNILVEAIIALIPAFRNVGGMNLLLTLG